MDGRERDPARLDAGRPARRAVLVTVGVLAMLVSALAPVLAQVTSQPSSATAAVALLSLAVAAYVALASPRLLPRPLRAGVPATAYDAWPTLRARVTDPEHHPIRPRAPGCR